MNSWRRIIIFVYSLKNNFPTMCSIDEASLARYLRRVEEGYPVGNPYHCRTHGADVVRAMYCLLTQGGVLQTVWPDEGAADMALLTGVFSAAIHDYEHKGVTVGGACFVQTSRSTSVYLRVITLLPFSTYIIVTQTCLRLSVPASAGSHHPLAGCCLFERARKLQTYFNPHILSERLPGQVL